MRIAKIGTPVALVAAMALSLSACATNEGTTASASTLVGKGASSVKAAQERWIADYQTAHSTVTVNYSPDGSGAGRDSFIAGAVDFAGSDRALNDAEMKVGSFGKCTATSSALNLPVYVSPIAVIYNVAGVTDLKLDPTTLAAIFKGTITKWNDSAIVALNPGVTLPNATITAVHRSDDSGTTTNFTEYLSGTAASVWDAKPAGLWPYQTGEAAKGTSGVVDAVSKGVNTIGYADHSAAGNLAVAKIKVGDTYVLPTAEGAAAMVEAATTVPGRKANDLALVLNRKATTGYPIVLVSYAIVCEQYKDSKVAALVKSYLGYIASAAGQTSAQRAAGSAPLSVAMQAKVKTAIDSIQ